ncbi:MAG: acyl-CoA dehydrogenase family protein [Syntrophales bacterium]
MATAISEFHYNLAQKTAHFAQKEIAPRTDIRTADEFPLDIWRKMAAAELPGLALPQQFGGLGADCLSIAVCGEVLVREGRNMGMALSWLIHLVVSRFMILAHGNPRQHVKFIPSLARGDIIACLAVSEPSTGAHPRFLKTVAEKRDGQYVLNGQKHYLTNGTVAGLFVIFAVTSIRDGKKQFTAFLVPKETPGLVIGEIMKLDFLRPSPHCGIRLDHCIVPAENILGEADSAYEKMVVLFRDIEDTFLMALITGGMERQMEILISLAKKTRPAPAADMKLELGRMHYMIHTLRILSYETASMLENRERHPEFPSLILSFRDLARQFQTQVKETLSRSGIEADEEMISMTNDLVKTVNLAGNIARIKQEKMGGVLFSEGNSQ